MTDQVKALARKFFEEQDRMRGGIPEDLCAERYEAQLASLPPMDLEAHKQFANSFYGGFPDLHHVIDDVVAEEDRAVVSFRLVGTNTGEFMGMQPSGKSIEVSALALLKLDAGKVTEVRGQFDQLGVMQQIGAFPG